MYLVCTVEFVWLPWLTLRQKICKSRNHMNLIFSMFGTNYIPFILIYNWSIHRNLLNWSCSSIRLTKAFLFRGEERVSLYCIMLVSHLPLVWCLFWSTLRRSCTAKPPLCSSTAQSQGLNAGSSYTTSGSWVSNSWPPPTLICLWRVRSMCSWHTSWSVRVKPKMTDFRCTCLVFYNSLINGCIFDIV